MIEKNLKKYVVELVMLKYLFEHGYLDFKEYYKTKTELKKKNNIYNDENLYAFSSNNAI